MKSSSLRTVMMLSAMSGTGAIALPPDGRPNDFKHLLRGRRNQRQLRKAWRNNPSMRAKYKA